MSRRDANTGSAGAAGAGGGARDDHAAKPSGEVVPHVPTGGSMPVPRQVIEQLAGAMQAQVELLKQMHDRQRTLEETVKDTKRNEMMITSTRALNDTFQGMQRSQERLAEQLGEAKTGGLTRGRFLALVAVLLAVGVGIGVLLRALQTDTVDAVRDLRSSSSAEAQAGLQRIEGRLNGLETNDRDFVRTELDRLRRSLGELSGERDALKRERDAAREELGRVRGEADAAKTAAVEARAGKDASDRENGRLVTRSLADQQMIGKLNELLAKGGAGAGAGVAAASPNGAGPATKPAPAPTPGNGPPVAVITPAELAAAMGDKPPADKPVGAADGAAPAAPATSATTITTLTAERMDELNDILSKHRGSDRYRLIRAEKIDARRLVGVTVEVRGADGSLAKTIDAQFLSFGLSARGDLLEVNFEQGSVEFSTPIGGRLVKSPFFNNRYQIVVLGIDGPRLIRSAFPFVQVQ